MCCVFPDVKSFQFKLKELQEGLSSIFTERTDEASAVQYFQVKKTLYARKFISSFEKKKLSFFLPSSFDTSVPLSDCPFHLHSQALVLVKDLILPSTYLCHLRKHAAT